QQGRIRLPSDAIPPRRYAGVERGPCEPRPAAASREWTGHLSGRPRYVSRLWRAGGTCRVRSGISGPDWAATEMRGPPSLARQAAPVFTSDAGGYARAWVAASSSLLVSASFFAVLAFSAAW